MKTIIQSAFIICLFAVTTNLSAQVKVNPKVGVNVSAIDAQLQDLRTEARAGWNAGVDFRVGNGFLFLNPGLHYQSYTADLIKDFENPEDIQFTDQTTIQAIRAPLNVGLRITGEGGLIGLHLKGGVTPSYVTGVKETEFDSFNIDQLNRFTWNANAGVGLDILFFTIDAIYEKGLNNYYNSIEGVNSTFTLNVGIKF